ncbi:MAG: excinuclease ABC subunit UvrC [Candidatus Ratteibacteria bacterium]|nr:excinuclease ABC subunit UvrC [Candidatus Ratteibacteria bacterium]
MRTQDKISTLPSGPGVYVFKDKSNNYLYIGKAENIRKRVKSHFQKPGLSGKDAILAKKTASIDYIVTRSAVEALILECNLIKEHKPKYNVTLKDDKSYPYIKIALGEHFPTVYITRDLHTKNLPTRPPLADKQAKYFGPYTDVKSLRRTLLLLRKIFLFKTCRKTKIDGKPCLNYHIARCVGPCTGKVSQKDYMEIIKNVSMFLAGETKDLISYLKKKMDDASASKEYEKAARFRDQLNSIQRASFSQTVSNLLGKNQDFIGYADSKNTGLIVLFNIRNGKLLTQEKFNLTAMANSEIEEAVPSFIEQYYSSSSFIPDEIFVPVALKEKDLLEKWLKRKRGKTVRISVPQRGANKKLLKMASDNAGYKLMETFPSAHKQSNIPIDLQERLNLSSIPFKIEGIDISNIRGKSAVGSVVVFENAVANKNEWRKFKIKSIDTSDDYKMMKEVLERRYRRMLSEDNLPDLVLVDGGKGQVSIAKQVFNGLGIENMPVVGIAKGENRIHLSYSSRILILNPRIESLRFLAHVRDESHRFAHSYFSNLRRKETRGK